MKRCRSVIFRSISKADTKKAEVIFVQCLTVLSDTFLQKGFPPTKYLFHDKR